MKIQRADRFYTSSYYKPNYILYTDLYLIPEFHPREVDLQTQHCPSTFLLHFWDCLILPTKAWKFSVLDRNAAENNCPLRLFQSSFNSIIGNVYRPPAVLQKCAKKRIFLVLPFTGKHGIQLRVKLNKLFPDHLRQLDLRTVSHLPTVCLTIFPSRTRSLEMFAPS